MTSGVVASAVGGLAEPVFRPFPSPAILNPPHATEISNSESRKRGRAGVVAEFPDESCQAKEDFAAPIATKACAVAHARGTSSPEPCRARQSNAFCEDFERMEEGFSPTKHSIKARYSLGDVIGEGVSCEVRTARDLQTGETWACKIVPMPFEHDIYGQRVPDWMATSDETRQEAELACGLKSPYIVRCREYFEEQGDLYLILELMSGGDLQDELVRLGNFTEDEARRAFLPIIRGLMHLHDLGVAHRDLNLENILLESPHDLKTAKLSDFGMARKATPLDPFRTVCGSAHYVAPEVLAGSGVYDTRCDMWSAGVCLFAMLSGYLPFDSDSLPQLLKKIGSGNIDFSDTCWALISSEARDLVICLLTVNPEDRLSAEEVLQHPWMRFESMRGI